MSVERQTLAVPALRSACDFDNKPFCLAAVLPNRPDVRQLGSQAPFPTGGYLDLDILNRRCNADCMYLLENHPHTLCLLERPSHCLQLCAGRYWEIDPENPISTERKRPYRIELVGVTCDAGLAVARGIWRKLRTGRSVPVSAQLRSHRLFSDNFEHIAHLVDSATLYHTGKPSHHPGLTQKATCSFRNLSCPSIIDM